MRPLPGVQYYPIRNDVLFPPTPPEEVRPLTHYFQYTYSKTLSQPTTMTRQLANPSVLATFNLLGGTVSEVTPLLTTTNMITLQHLPPTEIPASIAAALTHATGTLIFPHDVRFSSHTEGVATVTFPSLESANKALTKLAPTTRLFGSSKVLIAPCDESLPTASLHVRWTGPTPPGLQHLPGVAEMEEIDVEFGTSVSLAMDAGNLLRAPGVTVTPTYQVLRTGIKTGIWLAIRRDVYRLEKEIVRGQGWRYSSSSQDKREFEGYASVDVSITCHLPEVVGRLVVGFDEMLAGTVVADPETGGCWWDPLLFDEANRVELEKSLAGLGAHVDIDVEKRCVTLWGSKRIVSAAMSAIRDAGEHVIPESALDMQNTLRYGLEMAGEWNARHDYDNQSVVVTCESWRLAHVKHVLNTCVFSIPQPRSLFLPTAQTCPVCLETVERDGVVPAGGCGHEYHGNCLVRLTQHAGFPLVCSNGGCSVPMDLTRLEHLLSPTEFEALLRRAVTAYLTMSTHTSRHCPTPSCRRLYNPSTEPNPKTHTCTGCLTRICTHCHNPPHPQSLPCSVSLEYGPGIRLCPGCKVPIARTRDGCNHFHCLCGAHFCWACGWGVDTHPDGSKHLRTREEVYAHMRSCEGVFPGGGDGTPIGEREYLEHERRQGRGRCGRCGGVVGLGCRCPALEQGPPAVPEHLQHPWLVDLQRFEANLLAQVGGPEDDARLAEYNRRRRVVEHREEARLRGEVERHGVPIPALEEIRNGPEMWWPGPYDPEGFQGRVEGLRREFRVW